MCLSNTAIGQDQAANCRFVVTFSSSSLRYTCKHEAPSVATWSASNTLLLCTLLASIAEPSRCLDALVVALDHSHGEYTSVMQLQRASLQLCVACRSGCRLQLRVAKGTPRHLWAGRADAADTGRRAKRPCSTRVPALRPHRVTWELPGRMMAEQSTDAMANVKCVVFNCNKKPSGGGGVAWPESVEEIVFGWEFNQPIVGIVWPEHLQKLSFGRYFSQCVDRVAWPPSLTHLRFGTNFNKPISATRWPASLRELSFDGYFNQPISRATWPASLQKLSFGAYFNRSITGVVWPTSLRQLSFGVSFNQPIARVVWPAALQELDLGWNFNHSIDGVSWPDLQELKLSRDFNQPIHGVVWPASLKRLSFGARFRQPVIGVVWPASLEQLAFGSDFHGQFGNVYWPASLRQLTIVSRPEEQLPTFPGVQVCGVWEHGW